MGWPRPILTDSRRLPGLVASAPCARSSEDGVAFASPVNGDKLLPHARESACRSSACSTADIVDGVRRVHGRTRSTARRPRAEARALDGAVAALGAALQRRVRSAASNPNALFGIVQGGMFERPARRVARRRWPSIGFDGYAIGGLSVGEPKDEMLRIARPHAARGCRPDKPRYLMGVGTPEDLVDGVGARRRHVRLRACRRATRATATCSRASATCSIRNARYKRDDAPDRPELRLPDLRATSRAPTCTTCDRCGEMLGADARDACTTCTSTSPSCATSAARSRRAGSPPSPPAFAPIARAASDGGEAPRRTCLTGAGEARRQRAGRSPPVDADPASLPLAQPAAPRSAIDPGSLEAIRDRSRASTRRPRCAALPASHARRPVADHLSRCPHFGVIP